MKLFFPALSKLRLQEKRQSHGTLILCTITNYTLCWTVKAFTLSTQLLEVTLNLNQYLFYENRRIVKALQEFLLKQCSRILSLLSNYLQAIVIQAGEKTKMCISKVIFFRTFIKPGIRYMVTSSPHFIQSENHTSLSDK